jgi:arylsulfatase A
VVFAALVAPWAAAGESPAPGKSPPPNIVFLLADDLGWGELGCYGQTKIRTPNLDRLAREGMRFTRHYAGAPVCAPSRCVLLTGRHTGRADIRGNLQVKGPDGKPGEGQQPIAAETVTIAEVLQGAGYATAAMGKWGLGPADSAGAPQRQGFDLFFGYNCQAVAHGYYPSHLWRNDQRVPLNAKPIPGHARQTNGPVRMQEWTGERYAPDAMLAEAIRFLRDREGRGARPFFLYLPFIEPHVALQPPADLVASYPEAWDDRPYRGQCGYTPHPRPRAAYAALITSLDRRVGEVLRTLDESGLAENTLVLFTSDNGTTHGSPGDPVFGVGGVDGAFFDSTAGLRGRKGSVDEGGIRVPLLVRWPGRVKPGSTSDFPGYFADHFPTLCEAAGVPAPGGLDGISLLPTLTGVGSQAPRNPMVWVFPEYGGQVAVRLGDLKVVRRQLARSSGPGPWEVYDLAADPRETRDVAAEHPEAIDRAREVLRTAIAPNRNFPLTVPGVNDAPPGAAAPARPPGG